MTERKSLSNPGSAVNSPRQRTPSRRLSLSLSPAESRGIHSPRRNNKLLSILSPRVTVSHETVLREQIRNMQIENINLENANADLKNRVHQLSLKVYLLEETIAKKLPKYEFKRSVEASELEVVPK